MANSRAITPQSFQGSGYWTWPRDYANKQCHKVWWWSIEKYSSYRADKVYLQSTAKCFMGSGWLSNLAEIFCQQTCSQSLMIIQWKLFKLLSGQCACPCRRTCSHNTSHLFSNRRIKMCLGHKKHFVSIFIIT